MPAILHPQIALSVRVIVICSDHKLLWRDSYKGVGYASTLPESILHKIIIILICLLAQVFESNAGNLKKTDLAVRLKLSTRAANNIFASYNRLLDLKDLIFVSVHNSPLDLVLIYCFSILFCLFTCCI